MLTNDLGVDSLFDTYRQTNGMNTNQDARLLLRSHRLKFDFSASGKKTLKCAANEEKTVSNRKV